jgi:hypothetical protein
VRYIVRLERSLQLRVEALNFPVWFRFSRVTLALASDPFPGAGRRVRRVTLGDYVNAYSFDDPELPFVVVYRVFLPDTEQGEGYVWVFDLIERDDET